MSSPLAVLKPVRTTTASTGASPGDNRSFKDFLYVMGPNRYHDFISNAADFEKLLIL
jgi:hypothetical protein